MNRIDRYQVKYPLPKDEKILLVISYVKTILTDNVNCGENSVYMESGFTVYTFVHGIDQ